MNKHMDAPDAPAGSTPRGTPDDSPHPQKVRPRPNHLPRRQQQTSPVVAAVAVVVVGLNQTGCSGEGKAASRADPAATTAAGVSMDGRRFFPCHMKEVTGVRGGRARAG